MQNEHKINIDFQTKAGFTDFLKTNQISLALSTYQTGNVFFIGPAQKESLNINLIRLKRPMGISTHANSLFIGTAFQIYRFNNILPAGTKYQEADSFYVPQQIWVTGDQDCHDIVIEDTGRVVFVNTLHSCLATLDGTASFTPIWKPPNISEIKHEDRCHLNGLTLKDGKIAYASAFSRTNTKEGWRSCKSNAGVLWDIKTNQVILDNLSMPHSPRWYDNKLWLLESGTGIFGLVDIHKKKLVALTKIPGYLRGLTFYKQYAFIGASIPRDSSLLKNFPSEQQKTAKDANPLCGIFVVNITTGKVEQALSIISGVQEIYDLAIIPNCQAPKALELDSEEIERTISIGTLKF